MSNITMRTEQAKAGLVEMIDYIAGIQDPRTMRMVEIGCFSGDSTEIFCKRFLHVVGIDPWVSNIGDITDRVDMDEIYKEFTERMINYRNLMVMREFSYEACVRISNNSMDLVYIDGGHEYKDGYQDIENFFCKVTPGGFIAGHDYRQRFPGVMKAVIDYFGKEPDRVFSDHSWIVRV